MKSMIHDLLDNHQSPSSRVSLPKSEVPSLKSRISCYLVSLPLCHLATDLIDLQNYWSSVAQARHPIRGHEAMRPRSNHSSTSSSSSSVYIFNIHIHIPKWSRVMSITPTQTQLQMQVTPAGDRMLSFIIDYQPRANTGCHRKHFPQMSILTSLTMHHLIRKMIRPVSFTRAM